MHFFTSSDFYFSTERRSQTHVWLFILALLCAGTLLSQYHALPGADIAWLLLAAERWLQGGQFGQAIYELNTPFAVLLYAPSVKLGQWLSINPFFMTAILTTSLVIASVVLSVNVLRYRGYTHFEARSEQQRFLLAGLAAFLLIPTQSFGQRDHIIAALMLPYALLVLSPGQFQAHASEKKYWLNGLCTLGLAGGLLIKPQYCIAALAIHLLSFHAHKSVNVLKRGIAAIATILLFELIITYLFFPRWIQITQDTLLTYSSYKSTLPLVGLSLLLFIIIPLTFIALLENKNLTHLVTLPFHRVLFLISLAHALTFIYESKGWYYQALPLMIPLWILFLFQLLNIKKRNAFVLPASLMMGFLINSLVIFHVKKSYFDNPHASWLLQQVRTLSQPGDNFLCLSSDIACTFPTAYLSHTRSISRYACLWPAAGAKKLWQKGELQQADFLHYLNRDVNNSLEDIRLAPPTVFVIEWQRTAEGAIQDLSSHASFSAMLNKNYRLIERRDYPEAWSAWVFIRKK